MLRHRERAGGPSSIRNRLLTSQLLQGALLITGILELVIIGAVNNFVESRTGKLPKLLNCLQGWDTKLLTTL